MIMRVGTELTIGAASWFVAMSASIAQVVVGPESLVPLGIAVIAMVALVGVAIRVTRWVERLEHRLMSMEKFRHRVESSNCNCVQPEEPR